MRHVGASLAIMTMAQYSVRSALTTVTHAWAPILQPAHHAHPHPIVVWALAPVHVTMVIMTMAHQRPARLACTRARPAPQLHPCVHHVIALRIVLRWPLTASAASGTMMMAPTKCVPPAITVVSPASEGVATNAMHVSPTETTSTTHAHALLACTNSLSYAIPVTTCVPPASPLQPTVSAVQSRAAWLTTRVFVQMGTMHLG